MDGNVKAIELQGIVRNRTKIGVEDGQAEDLLNLRFVDGSWRTSGDGRKVYLMSDNANGYHYTQLYIHTNVYRHLLGVRDGKLWWFADIESDGVTFTPKSTPEELTAITGDMWITQTGHLLTVIDEADSFEYFVFKTGEKKYKKGNTNGNDSQNSREIFPFGQIKFNFSTTKAGNTQHFSDKRLGGNTLGNYWFDDKYKVNRKVLDKVFTAENFHNLMIKSLNEIARGKNRFTRPFLVVACIKDYAGEYHYASNPVLIHPGELTERINKVNGKQFRTNAFSAIDAYYADDDNNNILLNTIDSQYAEEWTDGDTYKEGNFFNIPSCGIYVHEEYDAPGSSINPQRLKWDLFVGRNYGDENHVAEVWRDTMSPVFAAGAFISESFSDNEGVSGDSENGRIHYSVTPVDLYVSIDESFVGFLRDNSDLFTSLSLFITPEVDIYDMSVNGHKGSVHYRYAAESYAFACYKPYVRKKDEVIADLMNSPFYLLREYSVNELESLAKDPRVDLSSPEYDGLLSNIIQQPMLSVEATSRASYLPKYTYQYNGRLHIANYNTITFRGYPLDAFYLHNHSVKVEMGGNFLGVLPNLDSFYDSYWQVSSTVYKYLRNSDSLINDAVMLKMQQIGDVFAQIVVDIETSNGITKVVRCIDTNSIYDGLGNLREACLNSLLTYPDYRAKRMYIRLFAFIDNSTIQSWGRTFDLTPHRIYNLSYYIAPDLLPNNLYPPENLSEGEYTEYISGNSALENQLKEELNTTEFFPNGLKVSKTDNPIFFPVENTYQIGSSEVLAMCSNSIAVGTGQTGAAPLYVFCSDGIYALFVDSSGEMTYTNARVIARDVLNNPRSVTPIDAGVAFTTDRGLMLIAGEQVQEIGQPAEGDVLRYTDDHSADFIKIAEGAFTKVADFPNTLCDKTDFLTYLTGAIVNYNHNERELMISNPEKDYSYILDRNGNWSRRDYSADEYIQNYPTSYRLRDGEFYKVDEEGDKDTTLEKRKEADNKFFYLSNVIKLESIGFKQAARFALRGYFDTKREVVYEYSDMCVQNGYFDIVLDYKTKIKPRTHYRMTFENQSALIGTDLSISYGARATNGDIYVSETGEHKIPDSPDYAPIELNIYTSAFDHGKDVDALVVRLFNNGNTSSICKGKITFQEMNDDFSTEQNDYIGCYIFGSYDGRKWAMLGGNEKQGKFTDIGCKIERTDVKFFRICLSGKLRGESRIDYMEISSKPSMLNGKIR